VENNYNCLQNIVRKSERRQNVRNGRKGNNCGDGKATRDADEGVRTTLCTRGETRKGPFASGQKHRDAESSSSGRGADSNDEENLEGGKRRRKNTLPATQEKEENVRTAERQNVRTAAEREEREERRQLLGREVDQGRRRRRTSDTLHEM
jgi:hypothetical protein